MKAKESRLLDFLRASNQFVIPIYQRPYRWEEDECRKLWDDVLRAGRKSQTAAHFVGSVVYIQDGLYNVTDQPSLLVIDGQQRMTTFMLLIEALARAQDSTPLSGDFAPNRLRHYYLKDTLQEGERAYKMLLSATDRVTLQSIIDGSEYPVEHSLRIVQNFELFCRLLQGADLETVARGLANILVVDISLERGHDNPQLIFESLNSTGKALGQADLIRNYVLMGLEHKLQNKLYREHWRPMEVEFGQEAYATQFDAFMRNYLTMKTGDIAKLEDVYKAFKEHAQSESSAGRDVAALVADVHRAAKLYCRIALGRGEDDKMLADAFRDVRELKAEATIPFLLELYGDYQAERLSRADLLAVIRLVEAYVFRRSVLQIPTNSHSRTFAIFSRELDKARYLESVSAQLLRLPSYRRFPTDDEFDASIQVRDLYNTRNRSFWLRRMENHGRKERVAVEEYTIEHILPQNENVPDGWKSELGPDWETVRATWLHTLGNLTLSGYNSELSDRPFQEKRDMKGGFKESPLHLNAGLGQVVRWDASAIQARAQRLARLALEVWASPKVSAEVEELLKPPAKPKDTWTILDHPKLVSGPAAVIYRDLRDRVLAMNPAITEEFKQLYVVYRAETLFLSVVPLSASLTLYLNLPFPELQDVRHICRDVTNVGHWCSGEVEVKVDADSDMTYIMALVGQAFEWQLEDVEVA
jgi:uncharacterized protein with ParB-like and HNH nuclease domain/predicted transport protein